MLEQENIDTIIHAAAQTHVDNSFGNSFAFTENNVMGTHVLIETAKTHGIKRFIHVSTDEVYGSSYDEEAAHVEADALEPTNPCAPNPHPRPHPNPSSRPTRVRLTLALALTLPPQADQPVHA